MSSATTVLCPRVRGTYRWPEDGAPVKGRYKGVFSAALGFHGVDLDNGRWEYAGAFNGQAVGLCVVPDGVAAGDVLCATARDSRSKSAVKRRVWGVVVGAQRDSSTLALSVVWGDVLTYDPGAARARREERQARKVENEPAYVPAESYDVPPDLDWEQAEECGLIM